MCPLVATRGGAPWFALGGSGGRRILPAVYQMSLFLADCGLTPDQAVAQPRVNVDGGPVVDVDPRLGDAVFDAIAAELPARRVEALVSPNHYANALIAGCEEGACFGAAQIRSPVSAAVGVYAKS
jgi:gamma-glutamyltranspeptidase/glutathione hydrolase